MPPMIPMRMITAISPAITVTDPDHDHNHDHATTSHGHEHEHGVGHSHSHGTGVWGGISTVFHLHGHSDLNAARATDPNLMHNEEGIRTVWLALVALTLTSLFQFAIVVVSGSVALFADLHISAMSSTRSRC